MSQTDPEPADPHQKVSLAAEEEQNKRIMKAFEKLIETITPWLFEVGNWLFGGLIAFILLVMASLITVGPVDPAVIVSTVAFALALPLNVTGLILLRLVQDLKHVGFEEELAQAFQEVGLTFEEQTASPTTLDALRRRRTEVVLSYCLGILTLSSLLTVTGIIAALWHMAWWIGVIFIAMVLVCQGIVIAAIATSQPPDPAEKKEQRRRYREEIIRQAKAQSRKNEKRT